MATGTKGLTLWCKNITKNYGGDVEIKNMTSSWKNGLAFCAIISHYRPDLIDFSKLSKENIAENNGLAFRTAEDELGIPALLDVEDMVHMKVPDRLSIMTYVSQYYNYFKDKVPGEIITHRIPSKKRPNKDAIETTPAKVVPSPGRLTIRSGNQDTKIVQNACYSCEKTVYLMERLSVEGKLFHRVCFKCHTCNIQLKTSTYEFDSKEHKFYCNKHYRDREKKSDEPSEKEHSSEKAGLTNIEEDTVMKDVTVPSKQETSPFKRNEQFVRKGIRPQSSPAEIQWEKVDIIKSKEEELHSPTKTKPASKSFLSNILKKKVSVDEPKDFANPSYQQHLELSNFMNQLDADKNAEDNVQNDEQNVSETSDLHAHAQEKSPNKLSQEVENDNKNSKGLNKKKFVLKVKKKKKKKEDAKNGEEHDKEAESSQNDTPFVPTRTTSKSDYENIDHLTTKPKAADPRFQDDAKIYDNNKLCAVLNTSSDKGEEKIYSELSPINKTSESKSEKAIYYNFTPEPQNDEKNINPLLLAARNRLQSSDQSRNQPSSKSSDNIEVGGARNHLQSSGKNNPSSISCDNVVVESQYSNIRSNLRKVRSTEIILDNEKPYDDENRRKSDIMGESLQDARSHFHKTGIIVSPTDTTNFSMGSDNSCSTPSLKVSQSIEHMAHKPIPHASNDNFNDKDSQVEGLNPFEDDLNSKDSNVEGLNPFDDDSRSDEEMSSATDTHSSSQMDFETISLKHEPDTIANKSDEMQTSKEKNKNENNEIESEDTDYKNLHESTDEYKEKNNDLNVNIENSNPFLTPESSPVLNRKLENTNPFLSSEDLLFESEEDEFDDSNPFAEDARFERRDTMERSKQIFSLKRDNDLRKSIERTKGLKKLGIDESNPFADDVMDELSDKEETDHPQLAKKTNIHVPDVVSHMPSKGDKKLILKTKQGHKVNRPVSAPVFPGQVTPILAPRPKKRAAPRPPQDNKSEGSASPSPSGKGTLKKRQAPVRPTIISSSHFTSTISNESTTKDDTNNTLEEPEVIETSEPQMELVDIPSPNDSPVLEPKNSTPTSPRRLERGISEKRKAPKRPPCTYRADEATILRGVALRDKQPKREEMEKELVFLETRQRELEMEGVVMEKKLRECSNDEPEEAYLLTWFELVNQKNLLLRRENELIYLCQELDFLQNQRRAEFELRQLMSKPDKEKTMEDKMREDELLADILNFVTKRSQIVDKMDEDRLREYEEDLEINSMMEAQGLTKSPTHSKDVVVEQGVKEIKEKGKKKKEKEKKKEKIKKKKSSNQ